MLFTAFGEIGVFDAVDDANGAGFAAEATAAAKDEVPSDGNELELDETFAALKVEF